ncbi:uncharacterized protein LOC136026781 [Artemia franciscana]|uniref:uncharacterized protein LOC136026781 n=1 Tax=Artemia franciscana TaxID=6661 RepID=UPI0032DB1ED0
MSKTIKNIVCQESSETTLPAPGLSLPGPEITLAAPGPTLSAAPGPTLPAQGPTLPAQGPTLAATGPSLAATEPALSKTELTSPAPGHALNANESSLSPQHTHTATHANIHTQPCMNTTTLAHMHAHTHCQSQTCTATDGHIPNQSTPQPSLTAPEINLQKSLTIHGEEKHEKKNKCRNFWKMCPFCHRTFESLEKHLMAKKGPCRKPSGESWTAAEAKQLHNQAKDDLEKKTRYKSYFYASQVRAAIENSKTLHKLCDALTKMSGLYFDTSDELDWPISLTTTSQTGRDSVTTTFHGPAVLDAPSSAQEKPSTSPIPETSSPASNRNIFSSELLVEPSRPHREARQKYIDSDQEDLIHSEEGSLYSPEGSLHDNSDSESEPENPPELLGASTSLKREWNWQDNVRKNMMKMGLYKVYTMNTKSAEEAKKMAKGVKLLEDFRKWAALDGEEKSKKLQNPFGCIQKIVYFVLEGTNYNWMNLHSASRVELFFAKLAECGMQGSSRLKYAQGFRKFIDYISSRGSEGPENLDLTLVASVIRALGHLDRKNSSLATREKRHKEHQRAFDPHSFNNDDYIKLKAGVEEFMAPGLLRLSKNRLLDGDLSNLTAYLCYLVSFLFGHRPGVPENMTVDEFMNRQAVKEEEMFVVLVEKHKTASLKSAGVALSLDEEKHFQNYLSFVRPALVKPGVPEPPNFLLSSTGGKLENVTKILKRFLEKIFPTGVRLGVRVPNQTTIRHLITTINRKATHKTQEERDMMFDYLCHSEITSKKHYESYVFQRIAKSRKLLEKCTEEAKKCSASEAKGNSDEEENSKKNQTKNMDEVTRKNIVKVVSLTLDFVI